MLVPNDELSGALGGGGWGKLGVDSLYVGSGEERADMQMPEGG